MTRKRFKAAARLIAERVANFPVDERGFVRYRDDMIATFEEFFNADNPMFDWRLFRKEINAQVVNILSERGIPETDYRYIGMTR